MKRIGDKILLLIKTFPKTLFPKLLIMLIAKMCGLTQDFLNHLPTLGSSIGEKKFKQNFQIDFMNGVSFLEATQTFFVPK